MPSHEEAQNPLQLNKETLQDLDVEANSAGEVKGGALIPGPLSAVALSGPHVAPTDPYLKSAITPYTGGVSQ